MKPVDRAIWWIEYTIRNQGTEHLKSTAKHISWFQYLLIDVVITFILITGSVVAFIAYLIQRLVRYSKSLPIEMVTRGSRKAKKL